MSIHLRTGALCAVVAFASHRSGGRDAGGMASMMRCRKATLRSVVVAVLLGISALPSTALAQAGVGIDPGKINGLPPIETDAPTSVAVTVRNPGSGSASFQMLAQPLNGEPELPIDPTWFSFEPATFDLDGGEAQEIQVTFTVPDGTNAGDYLALVTAQLILGEPETSGAQVGAAVATKLYFTVPPPPASSSDFPTPLAIGGVALVVVLGGGFLLYRRSGIRLSITRDGDRP
ncbi:MAG: hypothetical protein ACOYL9_05160 [Ilumatobacteraceae bacterium]